MTNYLFVVGTLECSWVTYTVVERVQYGLTMYDVMEQRLIFSSAVTEAGVDTTVDIARTFLSVAAALSMVVYILMFNMLSLYSNVKSFQSHKDHWKPVISVPLARHYLTLSDHGYMATVHRGCTRNVLVSELDCRTVL